MNWIDEEIENVKRKRKVDEENEAAALKLQEDWRRGFSSESHPLID